MIRLNDLLRYALATLLVLLFIALMALTLVALFGQFGERWQVVAVVLLMAPPLVYLFVQAVKGVESLLVEALKKSGDRNDVAE